MYGTKSSEAAFQAAKCDDEKLKDKFTKLSPPEVKRLGHQVQLVSNWDMIKDGVLSILSSKFHQNEILKDKFVLLQCDYFEEQNTWGDTYWRTCNSQGLNMLGKLLLVLHRKML